MKKFLITNILLAAGTIYGVNHAVDGAFEKKTFDLNLEKISKKYQALSANNTLKIKVNTELEEEFAELESLDFTPKAKVVKKEEVKRYEISYKEISKSKITDISLDQTETNTLKTITVKNSLELSYNEIKTKGAYKTEAPKIYAWNSMFKGIEYSEKNNEDRISTKLAATEKSTSIINTNQVISKDTEDELVFFDYAKSADQKVEEKVVVKNSEAESHFAGLPHIEESSEEIMATQTSVDEQSRVERLLALRDSEEKIAKTKKEAKSEKLKDTPLQVSTEPTCGNSGSRSSQVMKSQMSFKADSIDQQNQFGELRSFEIRFQDDLDEIHQDYGSGEISLEYSLNTQLNVRRINIFSNGHYPVAMDLIIEPGKQELTVPVVTEKYLANLLSKYNLRGIGAHYLVELDNKTEDVNIEDDSKFEAKIFLNKEFQVVKREESDYSYILFIGATPGNRVLSYLTQKNEVTTKIVHLSENEIYYDPNFYVSINTDRFSLFEESLLAKCNSPLTVPSEKVETWSFEGKVKKESLNTLGISRMLYPLGTRKYYELNHLKESIFIGRWNQERVTIPSEDYMRRVISEFDAGTAGQCIIQLNLSKPVKEFVFNGTSISNNMRSEIKVLDSDGQFYPDFSPQSKRVFIRGNEQGILNIKINYTDNSHQFIQSYCSSSTYLVEQL